MSARPEELLERYRTLLRLEQQGGAIVAPLLVDFLADSHAGEVTPFVLQPLVDDGRPMLFVDDVDA